MIRITYYYYQATFYVRIYHHNYWNRFDNLYCSCDLRRQDNCNKPDIIIDYYLLQN